MSWRSERARIAALHRSRPADDPDLLNAYRDMRAEKLAEHVASVVAELPPLTEQQCQRIAALLLAGGGA